MAGDTVAVPATGAGVERMFSRSSRVAIWVRARLNGITITETMLYKEFLDKIGQPLDEQVEWCRTEIRRKKTRKIRNWEQKKPVTMRMMKKRT